jgi:hypothetical protein
MPQNLAQERAASIGLWIGEKLFGRAGFNDGSRIHEHDRCATLRTKPISWVTTIMAMPSAACNFVAAANGTWEFSARLFSPLWDRCSVICRVAAPQDRSSITLCSQDIELFGKCWRWIGKPRLSLAHHVD